jgi:hypothetical protein
MIGSGSLTMENFAEAATAVTQSGVALDHLLPSEKAATHPCHYTVVSHWEDFGRRKPIETLNLLSEVSSRDHGIFDDKPLCSHLVLNHADDLKRLTPPAEKSLLDMLRRILADDETAQIEIKDLLQSVDAYSIRFAQRSLQILARENANMEESPIAESVRHLVFGDSKDGPSAHHISMLLQGAGPQVGHSVRLCIEEHILESLPRLPMGKNAESEVLDLKEAQFAIDQAFIICQGACAPSPKSMFQLMEKLSQLLKYLGSANVGPSSPTKVSVASPAAAITPQIANIANQLVNPSSPMEAMGPRSYGPGVIKYFELLLRVLCFLRPESDGGSVKASQAQTTNKSQSDQIKILILLTTLATHPFINSPGTVFPEHASAAADGGEVLSLTYDVIATYVDDISDEGRALCAKIMKDKIRDDKSGRLRWLFGSVNSNGSEIRGGEEMGKGLVVARKGEAKGEWHPRIWEVLEGNYRGTGDGETSLGLGLFGARR